MDIKDGQIFCFLFYLKIKKIKNLLFHKLYKYLFGETTPENNHSTCVENPNTSKMITFWDPNLGLCVRAR